MQSFDVYGHHAACCKRNSDIIVRHNRLRNLVHRIAEEGLLSPVLEKRFLLGESSGRRPGDVTIPCWKDSKGLAVDVAVTSTFSQKNLTLPRPADTYGLRKHAKYDEGFRGTPYLFCAAVLETTGGYSEEAVSFFRQLFRFAARQQNFKLCVYGSCLGEGGLQPTGFSGAGHSPQGSDGWVLEGSGRRAEAGACCQQQ
jgi:hypothetical protein